MRFLFSRSFGQTRDVVKFLLIGGLFLLFLIALFRSLELLFVVLSLVFVKI